MTGAGVSGKAQRSPGSSHAPFRRDETGEVSLRERFELRQVGADDLVLEIGRSTLAERDRSNAATFNRWPGYVDARQRRDRIAKLALDVRAGDVDAAGRR